MLTDETTVPVARPNLPKIMDSEAAQLAPVWSGLLHEFRNHLAQLQAATTAVRDVTRSSSELPEISPALRQTEWSVRRMGALLAFVDAAVRDGQHATVDLDKVIEGALRLAAPALGRVAVAFDKPHRIDVRNHGNALECLIAGLVIELAHAGTRTPEPSRRQQIDVRAQVAAGRGAASLEIDSDGLCPRPGSWRVALAHDLAARIGATVTTPATSAGFVVRLDSGS